MPVTIHKVALTTSDLAALSEASRRFLLLACHIANELATLQKILVGCIQAQPTSDIGTKAYAAQNLVIAKILAGKLREARRALDRYYFTGPSRELNADLPDDAKAALKEITTYFRGDNPITTVRNEVAFHYDGENTIAALSKVPPDHDLLFLIGEESGNSLYYGAEEVLMAALLDNFPGEDPRAAFDNIVRDTQVIARAFTTFCEGVIYAALMKAKPDAQLEEIVIEAADTAGLDRQVIRFFLHR